MRDMVGKNPPSTLETIYTSDEYQALQPGWHIEESPWKAKQILRMLEKHRIAPQSIIEVGCGVGEILWNLQKKLGENCKFHGYDIAPIAIEQAKKRENERLHFSIGDIRSEKNAHADLILLMDVLEHIEDRFGFLRDVQRKAEYKIFHVSLTISVQTVLRKKGLRKMREEYGMVNFYTKESLLQNLRDAGYEIVDYFYTCGSTELPSKEFARNLMRYPRKMLFALNQDAAARILGGYRLLILTK